MHHVANSTDYKPVWTGNPPADFGTDMAQLQTGYGNVTVLAAQADAASATPPTPPTPPATPKP